MLISPPRQGALNGKRPAYRSGSRIGSIPMGSRNCLGRASICSDSLLIALGAGGPGASFGSRLRG